MAENTKIIPTTVFTGFVGAGKTTIILNLIQQSPVKEKIAVKNEVGDVKVT